MNSELDGGNIRASLPYRIRLPLTAVCLLSGLILTILSEPRFPSESEHHSLFTVGGFSSLVMGILLRMWAAASISGRKSEQLVTTGPYSLTRNPLYLGTLLIVTGFLLLWHSATMVVLTIPPILIYVLGVVPAEERVLAVRHGDRFVEYARRVPRWIPAFRQYVAEPSPAFNTASFWKEVQSAAWWIGLGVLSHVLCELRAAPWWTEPLRLP